jgi:hypothetical protein
MRESSYENLPIVTSSIYLHRNCDRDAIYSWQWQWQWQCQCQCQ